MKTFYAQAIAIAVLLFFSTACKKLVEELKTHTVIPLKKIKEIGYVTTSDASDATNRITYFNDAGEPIKSIAAIFSYDYLSQQFYYDAKGRMIRMVYFYGSREGKETDTASSVHAPSYMNQNNIDEAHFYTHDANGNIATDTMYVLGGYPVESRAPYGVTHYEYDLMGRMVAQHFTDLLGSLGTTTINYTYNSAGNLSGHSYDNKLNYFRLSKVLMFLARDYSINNRLSPFSYEYNSLFLPTSVIGPTFWGDELSALQSYDDTPIGTSTITYN